MMDLADAVFVISVAVAAIHHRAKTLTADFDASRAQLPIAHARTPGNGERRCGEAQASRVRQQQRWLLEGSCAKA